MQAYHVSGQATDDWYCRLHILRSADNKQLSSY